MGSLRRNRHHHKEQVVTQYIITHAINGYILTVKSADPTIPDDNEVFEEQGEDKKHIVHMLYRLLEAVGELGFKHDEERVRIIRVNQEGEEIVD